MSNALPQTPSPLATLQRSPPKPRPDPPPQTSSFSLATLLFHFGLWAPEPSQYQQGLSVPLARRHSGSELAIRRAAHVPRSFLFRGVAYEHGFENLDLDFSSSTRFTVEWHSGYFVVLMPSKLDRWDSEGQSKGNSFR